MGSALRSEVITNDNIEQALNVDFEKRKKIINEMWSNYGKTFVEYLYLNNFKANNSHITIKGKNILDKIKNEKKKSNFCFRSFC